MKTCIKAAQDRSLQPLIIFDIDDTIIDCRHRKYLVIQDFIEQALIKERFPLECQRLGQMPWTEVCYRIIDTLRKQDIHHPHFSEELLQFWRFHYFSYPYLLRDQAFPQAISFVQQCAAWGAAIVYLTGRDEQGMGQGTRESMQKLGFPTSSDQVSFILKLDPLQDDVGFKKAALEDIAKQGEVVAAFENELPNLNVMAERFPSAKMYWRKTLYLPNPPEPHPLVETLFHFEGRV